MKYTDATCVTGSEPDLNIEVKEENTILPLTKIIYVQL